MTSYRDGISIIIAMQEEPRMHRTNRVKVTRGGIALPKHDPTSEWKSFFDIYAPHYMNEPFTRNTSEEVDFLIEVMSLEPGASVLDVGCGTGRHSIELARRGYNVTGVDISEGMLSEAARRAEEAAVDVEWIRQDAARLKLDRTYDACICLCEGAFGLLNSGEDATVRDISILRGIASALAPGSPFLLTALNALRTIRMYSDDDVAAGRFDNIALCQVHTVGSCLGEENHGKLPDDVLSSVIREKAFTAMELTLMLKIAGFSVEHIWGGTAGNWGRRPILMDEMELMVVARLDR
jgi:SAM-dependent methyltransferase